MNRGRRRRIAFPQLISGLLLLAVVAVPALAQTASTLNAACTKANVPFNRWVRLPSPRGQDLAVAANFDERPCTFVAATLDGKLYWSDDTGQSWEAAGTLPSGLQVEEVITHDLAAGEVLLSASATSSSGLDAPSGLYRSRDYGRSFEPIAQFSGLDVGALGVDPSNSENLYASTSARTGVKLAAPLMKSTDGGATWVPLPISGSLKPTAIAIDPKDGDTIWVNHRPLVPPGGLWVSSDGGVTFSAANAIDVLDVDAAPLSGPGSRIDAATSDGIVRSRDGGANFSTLQDGAKVTAIAHEDAFPNALMAVIDGTLMRSVDEGTTFRNTSLSIGSCGADLVTDKESPSLFVLTVDTCGPASGVYLYRSDGSDISPQSSTGGTTPGLGQELPRPKAMEVLAELPTKGDKTGFGSSGSVAFDGERFFYTDDKTHENGHINMMSTTGQNLGFIVPKERGWDGEWKALPDIKSVSYDATRNVLWAVAKNYVHKIDLTTHKATVAFSMQGVNESISHVSFDPAIGMFHFMPEMDNQLIEMDMTGTLVSSCSLSADSLVYGLPAASTPAGDGSMYVQLEDDITVLHVGRDCEVLDIYSHRLFAESSLENDQIACDTVTFPQPAVWIRDAEYGMVAFAVPDGYCPVPTTLEVTPAVAHATSGFASSLCANLKMMGTGAPIPGQAVRLFVEQRFVGVGTTNVDGRACVQRTFDISHRKMLDVDAAFLGSVSYLPSEGIGKLILSLLPVPPTSTPRSPIDEIVRAAALPPVVFPPPPPPLSLPPAVTHAPVPAAEPAPAPAQAPAGNAQPVAVAQRQAQPQMALVHAAKGQLQEQTAMVRTSSRADPLGGPKAALALGAISMILAWGYVNMAMSKVRPAWNKRTPR